jgi:hypothetical protein
MFSLGTVAAELPTTQYLLFQVFIGGPQNAGIYQRGMPKPALREIVRHISDTVHKTGSDPDRILGFAVGPIAMDEGADDARSAIRDAFDIALETDMAVALHLDDYMFWAQARWPDGRMLRDTPGTTEWKDWSQTPAGGLDINWLPDVKLAPQLCYESPAVKDFVEYWTREVIGREIKQQFDRLVGAGKTRLFAGVIAGWESNLSYGYCSLSHLGYSAQNPPGDFDHERERVLQRHIERWSKGIHDAGIPRDLIFTHLGPMPKQDYAMMSGLLGRARMRERPGSTAYRAFWTAFNSYSDGGFTAYVDKDRFADIDSAVRRYGRGTWAMAEGTNVGAGPGRQPLKWEPYLARNFNHGASIVNIFGGFQGPPSDFSRASESEEALTAYRKFLRGDALVEEEK